MRWDCYVNFTTANLKINCGKQRWACEAIRLAPAIARIGY